MTSLLLIDNEAERARRTERRLHLWGVKSSIADCFLYALTMLEWQRPDLILIRAEEQDGMTSREFCSTLKQDSKLRSIPLILIVGRGVSRVTEKGNFDLVLEDQDDRALGADLARFLKRLRQPEELSYDTAEDLSLIDHAPSRVDRREFVGLIEELTQGLRSGRLTSRFESYFGPIYVVLDHGQIVHAVFGGLDGLPAFRRLLDAFQESPALSCLFEPQPRWKVGSYRRSIQQADRRRLLDQTSEPDGYDTQVLKFKLPHH